MTGTGVRFAVVWARVALSVVVALLVFVVAPTLAGAVEEVSTGPLSGSLALGEAAEALAPGGVQLAEEARRVNPEAVAARTRSASAYEDLGTAAKERLAGEAFPGLVDRPAGGLSSLPKGSTVSRYLDSYAARISLASGKSALVESLQPIASEEGRGRWQPIDLSLTSAGGALRPRHDAPGGSVVIPKRLGEGVWLPEDGLSIAPVDEGGRPLEGEEAKVDGASAFFGDTEAAAAGVHDLSTLAKPGVGSVELTSMLYSAASPKRLYFKIGMPAGARLVQDRGAGAIRIVEEGATIGGVVPPSARDAEGSPVPVAMRLVDGLVEIDVEDPPGRYLMPVEVDPTLKGTDGQVTDVGMRTRWKFGPPGSAHFVSYGWQGPELGLETKGYYGPAETGFLNYEAQGEARIFAASVVVSGDNAGSAETYLQLTSANGVKEATTPIASAKTSFSNRYDVCFESCPGTPGNNLHLVMSTTGASSEPDYVNLHEARVEVEQEHGPDAPVFNTSEEHLANDPGFLNVLYGKGAWLGPAQGAFEVTARDPGVGISYLSIYTGGNTSGAEIRRELYAEGKCEGIFCFPELPEHVSYSPNMPDGYDRIEVSDQDFGKEGVWGPGALTWVHVDGTPPYDLKLAGLPANGELDEHPYHLSAQATDGSGSTVSSGIESVQLTVDGREVRGGRSGSCEPGPCVADGEWTLDAEQLGAGLHRIGVVAVDHAGNRAHETWAVMVHHPAPVSVSPGSVDPTTGAFTLSSTDASIAGGQGALSVARTFNSRQLTAGAEGPLGPQWQLSVGSEQRLEVLPEEKGAELVSAEGGLTMFSSDGKGGFEPPPGDGNLSLTAVKEGETIKEYVLGDPSAGISTRFVQPEGTPAEDRASTAWYPHIAEGALPSDTETYAFESAEGEGGKRVVRPHEALAPVPTGVSCPAVAGSEEPAKALKRGCRALTFNYAASTTASGEGPGEWGDFAGRLTRVYFTAWNGSANAMKTVEVAHYLYDSKGRLRSEWDPRISPALETTYGYDSEGHVVAVKLPGQQPSLLRYGTWPGDPDPGRLLSVTRPPASTSLTAQPAPVNTTAPTLSSGEAAIGGTLQVTSNGSWEHSPGAWAYQWLRCGSGGADCTPIEGAVNSGYTPQAADAGYTLIAKVSAINAAGAGSAQTAASNVIGLPAPSLKATFGSAGSGNGQLAKSAALASDGQGDLWVADTANNRVEKLTGSGGFLAAYGSEGSGEVQFKQPQGIAVDPASGNVFVADTGNDRIEELNSEGKFVRAFGSKGSAPGQLEEPRGVAVDSLGDLWVADSGNDRVQEFTATGFFMGAYGSAGSGNGQFRGPAGVAISGEDLYVTDRGNDRVQELSLAGSYVAQFGSEGSEPGELSGPTAIAADPGTGALYVVDSGNDRVQAFSPAGARLAAFGSKGSEPGQLSEPQGIAFTTSGDPYVLDTGNDRIEQFQHSYSTSDPAPSPPSVGENAVSTIDYQVPVSGSGAPFAMGGKEVEAWGQEDDPVEATAVFPPSQVEGWPAQSYQGASVDYFDAEGHLVDKAAPSGGISTTEYNKTGNVVRSLSADNRAIAIKEGSKSAETSRRLDSQSEYSAAGTELLSTLGPEHEVKLASGEEAQARNHVRYYYDEGAPSEGGPYDLVTKTVDGAQLKGGREAGLRVTKTSYSGQGGLGWKLRKPTSVVDDPSNGLNGVVIRSYGSAGSGEEQLDEPEGVAVAPNGNVFIADAKNNRLQELTAGPETQEFFNWYWGTVGLSEPRGVAVSANGDVYVADTGNKTIKEFTEEGDLLGSFGAGPVVGVAVGLNGDVYGLYEGEGVRKFSASGSLLAQFGEGNEGESLEGRNGILGTAEGIAVSPVNGEVFVTSRYKAYRSPFYVEEHPVQVFNEEGKYVGHFGAEKEGTGSGQIDAPGGITVTAEGTVYIVSSGNDHVMEFGAKGEYVGQYGSKGSGSGQLMSPDGVSIAPGGDMYLTDTGNDRVELWGNESYSGLHLSHSTLYDASTGQVEETRSPAAGTGEPEGDISYTYKGSYGTLGSGEEQLDAPEGAAVAPAGAVYVADTKNNRIRVIDSNHELQETLDLFWSLTQVTEPRGVAVAANGDVYVADTGDKTIKEFTEEGDLLGSFGAGPVVGVAVGLNGDVYGLYEGEGVRKFSASGSLLGHFGEGNEGESLDGTGGILGTAEGIAVSPVNGDVFVTSRYKAYKFPFSDEERPVQVFGEEGKYIGHFGAEKEGSGSGQVDAPAGISVTVEGAVYIVSSGNDHVMEFGVKGEYVGQYGSEGSGSGQLEGPDGVSIAPGGEMYLTDTGNDRVQRWAPPGESAPPMQTFYYSAEEAGGLSECNGHPEWAGLVCRVAPAYEPDTTGVPNPPSTTITYDIYDEPATTTEATGGSTRTTTVSYDAAGREMESSVRSSTGKALPAVHYAYSEATGAQVEESDGEGDPLKSTFNSLGQLVEYSDSTGNKSSYSYDIDGQVEELRDGKGSDIYAYDPVTGALTKLWDSGVGTFTASYDAEGRMLSESYPNGMSASYTYNTVGQATGLSYIKTSDCSEKCTWFNDSIAPSIHGETLAQTSTLSSESYAYDAVGRLTEAREQPASGGCKTRLYAYDVEGARTSMTSREPGSKGECATTGGTVEAHTYSEAGMLSDTGVQYDAIGDITKLPAADAEGHEVLSSFYASGQLATQEQAEQKLSYTLDPAGRILQTTGTGKSSSEAVDHYAGPGSTVAWAGEAEAKWSRDVYGIDGSLAAVETSAGEAALQLHDLQGNVVGTASLSQEAKGLLSTYDSSEFGVPTKGAPPKYSWLGAGGTATELPSGITNNSTVSYVPQLGATLQTETVIPPGATPNGSYNGAPYTTQISAASIAAALSYGAGAPEREASRQAAIAQAAEEAATRAATDGGTPQGETPQPEEESEEEEGEHAGNGRTYRLEAGSGTGGAEASLYKEFILTPGQALFAARAIRLVHKGIVKAPFFPEWADELLEHMPITKWDDLADDLSLAVDEIAKSEELELVQVSIEGTTNPKYFHLLTLVEAVAV